MFRRASLTLGAIMLIAGIFYRPALCKAADDTTAGPQKEAEKPRDDKRASNHGIGGTTSTERAVPAALVWLANHQMPDGSWSLQNYTQRCIDKTCTGEGKGPADAGATAMGLLPFLAAGQTYKSKGPHKEHVCRGIDWLIAHQQPDGNLAKGASQMMYSHDLATIALAGAYELSGDKPVGRAAQGR